MMRRVIGFHGVRQTVRGLFLVEGMLCGVGGWKRSPNNALWNTHLERKYKKRMWRRGDCSNLQRHVLISAVVMFLLMSLRDFLLSILRLTRSLVSRSVAHIHVTSSCRCTSADERDAHRLQSCRLSSAPQILLSHRVPRHLICLPPQGVQRGIYLGI